MKVEHNWKLYAPLLREYGLAGWSKAKLAKKYGISRQAMQQIIDKYVPDWEKISSVYVELAQAQRTKFRAKKANALRTGYTWEIKFGDLTWPSHCPILGLELDYFAEVAQENSPSFDRIDSSLGYVAGNVEIVSWRANRIKNNGTAEEHRRIADYLTKVVYIYT